MPGETDLNQLLKAMQPVMHDEIYVFATVKHAPDLTRISPLMTFQEKEGMTLILERRMAEFEQLPGIFPSRMITLNVHSPLEAVGFMAAITTRLAAHGISVNPVSGFFHDHIFVPLARAEDALTLLKTLSSE